MIISRLALGFILTLLVVIVLSGFLFLQSEIANLKNDDSSIPTPTSTVSINPSPTTVVSTPTTAYTPAPTFVVPANYSNTTITSYGDATLVCIGSLSYGVDGGPIFVINSLNITNIGTTDATITALLIQTYHVDGTKAVEVTKYLDSSGIYSPFPGFKYYPFTITPGETTTVINGRRGSYQVYGVGSALDTLASYTITPVNVPYPY